MVFDRKTLVIPDKTKFEEKVIVTKGDVVIADRSLVQFGIKTKGRIFVGEHVITDGDLEATNDVRIDIFSTIGGSIISGSNVYLGEKVKVKGKLSLQGDLDVGDSVEIENGFEAKGWINIRSPIPTVIYIFIYLLQLLKMGHSEEIERLLEELEHNDGETIPISESFLFIPNSAIIGVAKSRIDYSLRIGHHCKVIGNYDIKGMITIDEHTHMHGSLTATDDVFCGNNVHIYGNIKTGGDAHIGENAIVEGSITADRILMAKTAVIRGTLLAKHGTSFHTNTETTNEKILRFDSHADVVDEVKELLE
ncbi:MAG: polymer-forming cytoskeletal protein [Candidatus Thermoplasmatota archaeon]|nr:polymer-forming cytoskeletal protein [Candidatus Thermoplasmatota archaeon]